MRKIDRIKLFNMILFAMLVGNYICDFLILFQKIQFKEVNI